MKLTVFSLFFDALMLTACIYFIIVGEADTTKQIIAKVFHVIFALNFAYDFYKELKNLKK